MIIFLCLLLPSCNNNSQEIFQDLNKCGDTYFSTNNYTKALECWNKSLSIKPNAPTTYQKIGDCYYKISQYYQALQAYNKALCLQPEDWQTRLKVAKIQLITMDIPAALENWDKIKKYVSHCDILIFHGDLLLLQKRYSKAEHEYRIACFTAPESQNAKVRLAICLAGQGKKTAAKKIFSSLLKTPAQSADILLQMSNFSSINGDQEAAKSYINKAIRLQPHNINLQIKLSKVYLENGRYGQAITILKKCLQNLSNNRHVKKMLIESFLLANRYNEAEQLFRHLQKTEQKDLEFQILKGKYYLNTLKFQAAISQFQTILDNEPNIPLVHYFIGIAYLAVGMHNLGQKHLIKCLDLAPAFIQAELSLANIFFKKQSYDIALRYVERVKKAEPNNYQCYMIAGNIHLARHKYRAAIKEYQTAQLLNPYFIPALYYGAVCATYNANTTNKAIITFREIIKKRTILVGPMLQYAKAQKMKGGNREVVKLIKKLLKDNHNDPYLYYILGETYLSVKKKNEALAAFAQSITIEPNLKPTYLKLFDLYNNNDKQLEKTLNCALSKCKNFPEAYSYLASYYCNKGETNKAILLLEKGIVINSESPILANNLAWLYIKYQPDKITIAMQLAQFACEELPSNPGVLDTLGCCYFKKNMLNRATWMLEQAKEIDPNNFLINAHLKTIKKINIKQP